jgi:hypothetical protein
MTQQAVRGVISVASLVLEVVIGAWLLLLFLLALAWDPLDRRLGWHARRHAERLGSRATLLSSAPGAAEAFGVAPAEGD